mmetsp:Transcript_30492/g.29960  ORF Transcript_30492/g.29960 Transcript_30492/m.29960 type:complete len:93 (+) Transcript_30492:187-465(+)
MLSDPQECFPTKQKASKINKKPLPDISENLTMILKMINSFKEVSFRSATKSSRGLHNGASSRRSQYIGVLGNGKRWQVLINVASKKKYIGTY